MMIRILMRRRWVAFGAVAACLIVGAIITIRSPRNHSATLVLLIEQATPDVLSEVREVYELGNAGYWASKEYYETQYRGRLRRARSYRSA